MAKFKFEYIWLDGYKPDPNLRSKTKVLEFDSYDGDVDALPEWSFDGSSTQQAEGRSSDCLLKPVAVYPDAARTNAWLVVCEVLNPDGTPMFMIDVEPELIVIAAVGATLVGILAALMPARRAANLDPVVAIRG